MCEFQDPDAALAILNQCPLNYEVQTVRRLVLKYWLKGEHLKADDWDGYTCTACNREILFQSLKTDHFSAKEKSRPKRFDAADAKQREDLESEEDQRRHKEMVDENEKQFQNHLRAHDFHESEQDEELDMYGRTLTELRCNFSKSF